MGWVSLLEDALERMQDSIRLAEDSLNKHQHYTEEHRVAGLRALGDAKAILADAWKHLELATSPEIDAAHSIMELENKVRTLEHNKREAQSNAKKFESEAANNYAELQDTNREITALKKQVRKLEKQVDKMAHDDFGSAVDAFSSPGMVRKHKPNA